MELHVFDFDGTLFKSPEEPSWWNKAKDGNWWISPDSLGRPCVPDHPDSSWWVSKTLSRARKSISSSGVVTIMCTGRPIRKGGYRWRIPELLKQQGLDFDHVALNNTSTVKAHKQNTVAKYLKKYPTINTVQVWDDRMLNLDAMRDIADKMGCSFFGYLVHADPKLALCSEEGYGLDTVYDHDPGHGEIKF